MSPRVTVLVVDDSASQRGALIALLNADPELSVIGWATNGADAVRATALLKPDVIAMDLHMPGMNGLEATRQILRETPTPIVLVSPSAARDDQLLVFQALDAGVLAVLSKPDAGPAGRVAAQELCRTLKNMARVHVLRRWTDERLHPVAGTVIPPGVPWSALELEVVAIGASTGGPQVLHEILVHLPNDFGPPVLVVQHIEVGFDSGLVDWLGQHCGLPVKIAVNGQALNRPGVWIAPTGSHMGVRGRRLALVDGEPISLHRPSITHLFQSVALEYRGAAICVLLTGMGDDGAVGLRDVKRAGGTTIAQDEATSVVFGMPSAAIRLGVVDYVVPPPAIAPILLQRSRG
jgi:two-component system, chemotaxis family, protein-glutamate methylesterase/glutaminase